MQDIIERDDDRKLSAEYQFAMNNNLLSKKKKFQKKKNFN